MAAVLACGAGAALSHYSAAGWWRMLPPASGACDITVPGRIIASRRGIRVHCVTALEPRDVRTHDGIRITAPARTLLDIASDVTPDELERVLAESIARGLVRPSHLRALLARTGSRPGVAAVRALLEVDGFRYHSSRSAFERDRLRDAELAARGLRVVRVTWRQIVDAPEAVAARLAAVLAIAG